MISIIRTTLRSITVQVDDKVATVVGESFIRLNGSLDFIIDISSIKNWDKPFDKIPVSEREVAFIVAHLLKEKSFVNVRS